MTALDPAALLGWSQALTTSLVHTAIAAGLALALHLILFAVLDRLVQLSPGLSDDIVVRRLRQPLRWSMVGIALAIARESDPGLAAFWAQVGRFIVPALMGWVAWALVKAFAAVLEERNRLARELHDSVTQALYSIVLYADATRLALAAGKQPVASENLA
ncbi:MAG TPA: histidine kinase dimerization/phosphoacceptor domain-containing protein, partial [Novosphingobium sp.]|nr:histidine kinase dimerization/phosphoacceptor domain-containing protein [Novosphingobium sp.]